MRAKARCMELKFANAYSIQTSGGPSFSWLEMNETEDREVSLDAGGKARDEDEESEERLLEESDPETEDAEESEDAKDTGLTGLGLKSLIFLIRLFWDEP